MEEITALQDAAPSRRVRYLITLLIMSGVTIAYSTRIALSIGIVAMTDNSTNEEFVTFDWDQSTQSTLLSSFFWGYVLASIPSGLLIQKYGARWFLLGSQLTTAVVFLLIPVVTSKWSWEGLCVLRVVQGVSQAPIFPSLSATLSKWAPPAEMTRLAALCFSGIQAGSVLALAISGALADSSAGWPSIFYFFGGLGLAWCLLWFFLGFNSPADHPYISERETTYIKSFYGKTSSQSSFKTPFLEIASSIPMWALLADFCVYFWGLYVLMTEMPSYMSHILKYNIKDNGLLGALPYIFSFFAIFASGWLSDLLINRDILRPRWARKTFTAFGFLGPMLTMIGLSYVGAEEKELAVTLLVISCALSTAGSVGFQVNHVELAPNFAGILMAITNSVGNCASLVVPLVVGAIVTNQESEEEWHTVFWVTAGAYLLGSLVSVSFSAHEIQPWNKIKN